MLRDVGQGLVPATGCDRLAEATERARVVYLSRFNDGSARIAVYHYDEVRLIRLVGESTVHLTVAQVAQLRTLLAEPFAPRSEADAETREREGECEGVAQ